MKTILIILSLLLNHNAFAQQTANTGAPVGCPFTNTSPTDSIAQVRASLRSLAGSSGVCNQMISQNATSLDTLLNSILEERFPIQNINLDGTTPLTCENFEAVLSREKQLVMDAKNNEYYTIGTGFLPRYRQCEIFKRDVTEIDESTLDPEYEGLTQSQRFDICIEKVYQENFYRKVEECEIRGELERENRRNEAYRARVTEITRVATNLISSSQDCSNADILRSITQTIIPLITTVGTFAYANPLVGVGMALGGNLASALVDRFFNTNGPNEYIALLENEEQTTNLNCLYYQVQNDVLACGRPSPFVEDNSAQIVGCYNQRQDDFLRQIYDLSQAVRRALGSNDPLAQADIADEIRRQLEAEIRLPDGTMIKSLDYLDLAAASLRSDPSKTADVITARRLDKVKEAYNDWNAAVSGPDGVDEEKIIESNAKLMTALKGEGGQQPLDLVDTMRRYWSRDQRENSQSMIGRLRAMENPGSYFSPTPQQSSLIRVSRGTRISHDALVHLYQQRFANKLEEQHEGYLRNRKPSGDGEFQSNLDYLIPLFQSCSLNAGMHYYQARDEEHHSVNRVSPTPTEKYQQVCGMFQCPGDSLLPAFNPSSGNPDTIASQFRNYQCAVTAQYNQMLNRLVNNYRRDGQICPRPPAPVAQSDAATPAGQDAANAYAPTVPADTGSESGGGLFGWLGNLFKGIGNFFKNLF